MKFALEIEMKDENPATVAGALGEVSFDLQRNGLLGKGEIATIPDKNGHTMGRWEVTDGPELSEAITLLKDIYDHLDGGATLHPGSLIFEEDAPAVAVIGSLLRRAGAIPARP